MWKILTVLQWNSGQGVLSVLLLQHCGLIADHIYNYIYLSILYINIYIAKSVRLHEACLMAITIRIYSVLFSWMH